MDKHPFGDVFRRAFDASGLSQGDLGDVASQPYISQLMNGERRPSRKLAIKLAAALYANVDEFLLAAGHAPTHMPTSGLGGAETFARFWDEAEADARSRLARATADAEREAIHEELAHIKLNKRSMESFTQARAAALDAKSVARKSATDLLKEASDVRYEHKMAEWEKRQAELQEQAENVLPMVASFEDPGGDPDYIEREHLGGGEFSGEGG